VPDPIFADPRLSRIYDPGDPDRSDLEAYDAIVDELGAGSVLDVGCGTGTFAVLLAARGIEVVGVDPAAASLDVARASPMPSGCAGSTATPRPCRHCRSTSRR
jgi:2-polyprenyl-3-methyl-5-hydroxy-6-metoxy-1,4-benzoquinol methylase